MAEINVPARPVWREWQEWQEPVLFIAASCRFILVSAMKNFLHFTNKSPLSGPFLRRYHLFLVHHLLYAGNRKDGEISSGHTGSMECPVMIATLSRYAPCVQMEYTD